LNVGASSAVGSGTTLTLNLTLTFQPSFTGTTSIWAAAASWDGLYSGWQYVGSWTPSLTMISRTSIDPVTPVPRE
jgi:hypothetical protein